MTAQPLERLHQLAGSDANAIRAFSSGLFDLVYPPIRHDEFVVHDMRLVTRAERHNAA